MYTLTAVGDEIKLSTVESYMCWSGKVTDIFEEFVPSTSFYIF